MPDPRPRCFKPGDAACEWSKQVIPPEHHNLQLGSVARTPLACDPAENPVKPVQKPHANLTEVGLALLARYRNCPDRSRNRWSGRADCLSQLSGVSLYEVGGSISDHLIALVSRLEPTLPACAEIFLELGEYADVGAGRAIDGLPVVSDSKNL